MMISMPGASTSAVLAAALLMAAARAPAHGSGDEVKAFVADWYQELRKGDDVRIWDRMAPGAVVAPWHCPPRDQPQPRVFKKHPVYPHLLARKAQKFAFEIQSMHVETTLARMTVWERGWIYAWAAKQTYENAAAATFLLEKKQRGGWKVLLYASEGQAVRSDHRHQPMPDLSIKEP